MTAAQRREARGSRTRMVGVLGWPLELTLSPAIHNAAFRRLGLDWVYLPWAVEPEMLGEAIAGLRALGAIGANVTMPHKQTVIAHMDELRGDAAALGAVNTIELVRGRVVGHNTDVRGFRTFLEADAGFAVLGKTSVVLGSGGAARAVVRALDEMGAARVVVCARRPDEGRAVADLARRAESHGKSWDAAAGEAGAGDLLVNASPVGMQGEDVLPNASFHPGQTVVDLIYEPPSTPLIERARASGADAWGGLGMLVHQAAASFRIWTGHAAPIEVMSAAAIHAIGRGQTEL